MGTVKRFEDLPCEINPKLKFIGLTNTYLSLFALAYLEHYFTG
jgi:hypothetical protein